MSPYRENAKKPFEPPTPKQMLCSLGYHKADSFTPTRVNESNSLATLIEIRIHCACGVLVGKQREVFKPLRRLTGAAVLWSVIALGVAILRAYLRLRGHG